MERDKRIEKVNAFRKLLDTSLKTVTKDETLQAEVQVEFQAWVSAQLDALMGNDNPNNLSRDEVEFIRTFYKKAQSKVAAPASTTPTASAVPAPRSNRTEEVGQQRPQRPQRSPDDPRPVGDRLRNRKNLSLEQLEDEGPDY